LKDNPEGGLGNGTQVLII